MSAPGEVKAAVIHAVKTGYRHLDLARIYCNQEEIGEAFEELFKDGVVKREDLFITSKLWNNAHKPELVEKAYNHTLKQLKLSYLDLYLIHWPVAFVPVNGDIESDDKLMPPHPQDKKKAHLDTETSLAQTWQALVDLKKAGKIKSIGVSNFTPSHIEGIIKSTGFVPAVNQIEAHPLLPQEDLVQYCKFKDIHLTAYSPLGNSANYLAKSGDDPKKYDLITADEVQEVAKKLNAEPGQVLIAWGAQRGNFSIIPKSVNPKRIEQNFKQIELSPEDFQRVSDRIRVGGHKRFNIPMAYEPVWKINVVRIRPFSPHSLSINLLTRLSYIPLSLVSQKRSRALSSKSRLSRQDVFALMGEYNQTCTPDMHARCTPDAEVSRLTRGLSVSMRSMFCRTEATCNSSRYLDPNSFRPRKCGLGVMFGPARWSVYHISWTCLLAISHRRSLIVSVQ